MKRLFLKIKSSSCQLCIAFGLLFAMACSSGKTDNKHKRLPFDLQGHRGARGLMPENSIEGFKKAIDCGVNTLEMDVVVSKDSQIVVSHEPWFSWDYCLYPDGTEIPKDDTIKLYSLNYADIKIYDCGSKYYPRFPLQQKIKTSKPLLEDVIDTLDAYCRQKGLALPFYNIETKIENNWDEVYTPSAERFSNFLLHVLRAKKVLDRTVVQSFDVRTLLYIRHFEPQLEISLLVEKNDLPIEYNLSQLGFIPDIYSPDFESLDESKIEKIHKFGMKVIPWTVNDTLEIKKLKGWGVDGVITDFPTKI